MKEVFGSYVEFHLALKPPRMRHATRSEGRWQSAFTSDGDDAHVRVRVRGRTDDPSSHDQNAFRPRERGVRNVALGFMGGLVRCEIRITLLASHLRWGK